MNRKATHFDARGRVKMVDVGPKVPAPRMAVARGEIRMSLEAFQALRENRLEKGEAIAVAKTAGILAAKRTAEWIPLCHPLPIDSIEIDFRFLEEGGTVEIESRIRTEGKTGVEMEALVAVSASALALYDMVKALDKSMMIGNIRLVQKTGGRSGTYVRAGEGIGP